MNHNKSNKKTCFRQQWFRILKPCHVIVLKVFLNISFLKLLRINPAPHDHVKQACNYSCELSSKSTKEQMASDSVF